MSPVKKRTLVLCPFLFSCTFSVYFLSVSRWLVRLNSLRLIKVELKKKNESEVLKLAFTFLLGCCQNLSRSLKVDQFAAQRKLYCMIHRRSRESSWNITEGGAPDMTIFKKETTFIPMKVRHSKIVMHSGEAGDIVIKI